MVDDLERLEAAIAKVDVASVAEIGKALLRAHQESPTGDDEPDNAAITASEPEPAVDARAPDEVADAAPVTGTPFDAASTVGAPATEGTVTINRRALERAIETIETQAEELERAALVLATARLRLSTELRTLRRALDESSGEHVAAADAEPASADEEQPEDEQTQ